MPKDTHRPANQTFEYGKSYKVDTRMDMLGELARKGTNRSGGARSLVSNPPRQGLALVAILILSAFLNLYGLTSEGYSNKYYSAAVTNVLTSWSNFFFVSFDGGFVSVDKPPLGLWRGSVAIIQRDSTGLFGTEVHRACMKSLCSPHRG